ncbi:MAG: HPr family phosphocarrier protein [Rhabdochlamydiaceae bacterium]|nr:HPr family phosphocarrier protein [Rhabdochlamydiaceae bacterium]
MKKVVHKVKVKNPLGLHARPAAMISKLLQGSKSQVTLSYRQETVNARIIMIFKHPLRNRSCDI